MRIVLNHYDDGKMFATETATDGSVVLRDLTGPRRPSARISTYVEITCDDNDKGLARLEEGLEYLLAEVRKRRGQLAGV